MHISIYIYICHYADCAIYLSRVYIYIYIQLSTPFNFPIANGHLTTSYPRCLTQERKFQELCLILNPQLQDPGSYMTRAHVNSQPDDYGNLKTDCMYPPDPMQCKHRSPTPIDTDHHPPDAAMQAVCNDVNARVAAREARKKAVKAPGAGAKSVYTTMISYICCCFPNKLFWIL